MIKDNPSEGQFYSKTKLAELNKLEKENNIMKNQIKIFENNEFGKIRAIEYNNEPYFVAQDIASALGYKDTADAVKTHCKYVKILKNGEIPFLEIAPRGMQIINEKDIFRLIMRSKLESAEKFQDWVCDEILPSIRKNGGYVQDASQFINAYFPNMEQAGKDFLVMTLNEKLKSEKELAEQKLINEKQTKEIEYKEDVIIGLVKDIDLESKRQVLSTVMKHKNANYRERWQLLYSHFEKKYHLNLKIRRDNWDKENKPRSKSMIDFVDRGLNMIPEIYEIACKIFENDINEILEHYKNII